MFSEWTFSTVFMIKRTYGKLYSRHPEVRATKMRYFGKAVFFLKYLYSKYEHVESKPLGTTWIPEYRGSWTKGWKVFEPKFLAKVNFSSLSSQEDDKVEKYINRNNFVRFPVFHTPRPFTYVANQIRLYTNPQCTGRSSRHHVRL